MSAAGEAAPPGLGSNRAMNRQTNYRVFPDAVGVAEFDSEELGAKPASLEPSLSLDVRRAILLARNWFLDRQARDGHWVGELEGDTILESEYILLLAYLGRFDDPILKKAANYLLEKQLPEGGWSQYPGGEPDVSITVKAYWALKIAGRDPSEPALARARSEILRLGGADAVNSFTRFYFALLGQISYDQCPAVPPEFMLLPNWFPVNLYSISAWSRTILAPLSVISAHQPQHRLGPDKSISELFLTAPSSWPLPRCPGLPKERGWLTWERFFHGVDGIAKFCQRRRWTPLRRQALRKAESWMLERFHGSDGLGAIFPPMVWSIIALGCLGYEEDSNEQRYCREVLEGLILEEPDSARLQPCKSPVWDTSITVRALVAAGLDAAHPAVAKAVDWLLDHEVRRAGDWSQRVRAEPGGWCFEYANEFYPDLDDTAMVSMALLSAIKAETAEEPVSGLPPQVTVVDLKATDLASARRLAERSMRVHESVARASAWMQAMQNRDGGWGAFDKDNVAAFLCYVPFADHNAMIDPSSPDLAGRVLESLAACGLRSGHPVVDRCIAYLRSTQEPDGSWYGRWGVNYIYGVWQVLCGLRAVGVETTDPAIAAGANWLLAHQDASGGWGESPDTYAAPNLRGQGKPTASQTAWAVLGLVAAGFANHPATRRGAAWLAQRQNDEGTWTEDEFTGTGFPLVFYLKYHLYPAYFPLMALAAWARASDGSGESLPTASAPESLRPVVRREDGPLRTA